MRLLRKSSIPNFTRSAYCDTTQFSASKLPAAQRSSAQGRGQKPRRVHSDLIMLDTSLRACLAYDFFRFLRRPLESHRYGRPSNCCCGGEDGGGGKQFWQQFHGLLLTVGESVVFFGSWGSSLVCCVLCSNSISIKLMGSLSLPSARCVR